MVYSYRDLVLVVYVKFGVIVEKDEDGYYVASVPELPGCHTQAKTLDEVMKRIKEAIEACLEVEGSEKAMGYWSQSKKKELSQASTIGKSN